MISAPARPVPARAAVISAATARRRSSSARSALVSATMPRVRPSRSRMARCSRVCGMTPSSAATTSSTKSMPVAPASMLWTSFSWPGTSMKPTIAPIRARPVGEAEIDGDAARLLLLQPVGVDAGQRPHQSGLAVIDMAGGADDHAAPSAQRRSGAALRLAIAAPSVQAVARRRQERLGQLAAAALRPQQPAQPPRPHRAARRRPGDAPRRASPGRRHRPAAPPCATIARPRPDRARRPSAL